uniref:Innexin n=1 Tax=Ditylenchus dipsaci TaxID=166011 RepID=A0A915EQT3_9BILA
MARMVFSEVAGTLSFLRPQCDDDMVDRLHYYYTTSCLLVTAVLISLKMFGGSPVECWLPAEFQSSWQEYTELMCWSRNTYYVQFQSDIPREEKDRENLMISYYQWTPFFLVLSAFFFYSPCLIWRLLYAKSGIVLKEVVAFAIDPSNIQQRHRDANLRGISVHLSAAFRHRFRWNVKSGGDSTPPDYVKYDRLNVRQNYSLWSRLINLRFYEAYLTYLYLSVKLLFLANVMAQAYLMNHFLQTDEYDYYGWDLFNWLLRMIPSEARMSFIARRLELADIGFKRELYADELEEFVQNTSKWMESNTAEPKDEDDTFTENQDIKQEAAPRFDEKAPQCSCTARQPLLTQQRKKVPVLAPLMTRHDPYYYSQFHGGQPGDVMASGGGVEPCRC